MSKLENSSITYIEEIFPPLTKEKISDFLSDFGKSNEFKIDKNFNFSNIPNDLKNLLTQVFIRKNLKNRAAIKARFAQYFEYSEWFSQFEVMEKNKDFKNIRIDYILKNILDDGIAWVISTEVLDQTELIQIKNSILKIYNDDKKNNKTQNQIFTNLVDIFLICGKIDRKLTTELDSFEIDSHKVNLSYFLEFSDSNRLFKDEDLIIVDDLKIRGFNFNSIEDILSLIKKTKGKGQYAIFKEDSKGIREIIWQGFIFPRELLV